MPQHILLPGREIISALERLGSVLGYHVEPEWALFGAERRAQAVDVAWFAGRGHNYPLFIFEVESTPSSSMANNVIKVFGHSSERLQKPLFFFHVIVSGGQYNPRIEALENQFGSYNYRAYRLSAGDLEKFLHDILTQHSRVRNRLNLAVLIPQLDTQPWNSIDVATTIVCLERLGFERGFGTLLPSYAKFGLGRREFRAAFVRYLKEGLDGSAGVGGKGEGDQYESYFGSQWRTPIHLGILAAGGDADDAGRWLRRLQRWQAGTWGLTAIGPHFGLSQDYECFVVGLAGPLWALIAALTRDSEAAIRYVVGQCVELLGGMADVRPEYATMTAIWLLHIAAASGVCGDEYEDARRFIDDRGGAPGDWFWQPADGPMTPDDHRVGDYHQGERRLTPPMRELRAQFREESLDPEERRDAAIVVALEALVSAELGPSWYQRLTSVLHG